MTALSFPGMTRTGAAMVWLACGAMFVCNSNAHLLLVSGCFEHGGDRHRAKQRVAIRKNLIVAS